MIGSLLPSRNQWIILVLFALWTGICHYLAFAFLNIGFTIIGNVSSFLFGALYFMEFFDNE